MRIGIKTITGIGLAAILSLGVAVPAHADGNNSGDSFANATDNSKTITVSDAAVGFKYTSVGAYDVDFTWNPTAFGTSADPITWCEVSLDAKNPFMPGYVNGYQTFEGNTTASATFGPTKNNEGGQDVTVTPGASFRIKLLCHNSSDLLRYAYNSAWFTAKEVPTDAPTKPVAKLYNGTDILAMLTGGFPNGEAWADHCLFRLYKNGSIIKTANDVCTGGISHTFTNLAAGTYQVDTATINPGGQSGWSPLSAKVTVKAGATTPAVNVPTLRSKIPGQVNVNIGMQGTKIHLGWSKAKTNSGAAIKQYKVVLTKGKKTTYRHTFAAANRAFTKTFTHGTYTVKITAVNKAGKQTTTSTKVKL